MKKEKAYCKNYTNVQWDLLRNCGVEGNLSEQLDTKKNTKFFSVSTNVGVTG